MNDCQCHKIVVETESPTVELSVEPVNETERTSFYNLDDVDWIGAVNSEGALVPSTKSIVPVFNGITDVGEKILYEKFKEDSRVIGVVFPDLVSLSYSESIKYAFMGCPNIEYARFPKLERITGVDSIRLAFAECPRLTDVSFPSLKYVYGTDSFLETFILCNSLEHISFPELEEVGDGSFLGAFDSCSLKSASFPKLKRIGVESFRNFLIRNYELDNADFSSLEEAGANSMIYCFGNCDFKSFVFPKLTKLGYACLTNAFYMNRNLEEVSFPALTAESVNVPDQEEEEPYTGYFFYNMLSRCSNVTVHFPADTEDLLCHRDWVLNGLGGTNTTILFDINPCYVEINVIGSQDYHIYVYGIEKFSPFTTGESEKEYCVIAPTQYIAYFGMLTGLVVGETTTFTADLTEANKEIVLNVPSDTTLQVKYGDIVIPLETVYSGVYSFLTNGSGQEFSYVITESPTTRRTEGTFTIDGSSMSITLTPTPKEWVEFIRPNLTADGTLGGDAFAVWSSGTYSTSASRQAWRAVDGNTSSSYYWYSKNEANPIYEFYNPYPIKVASLTFYWTSASYCAKSFVLNVSNDGSTWTSLGTFNLTVAATATANINSANAYKYYRMTFTKQGTYLRLKELEMSATKYE